jgi:hypothetical protein
MGIKFHYSTPIPLVSTVEYWILFVVIRENMISRDCTETDMLREREGPYAQEIFEMELAARLRARLRSNKSHLFSRDTCSDVLSTPRVISV